MKKVLIKKDGKVSQQEYENKLNETDDYYYYVYYSGRPNSQNKFTVFTNQLIYEETRVIFESDDKDEAIRVAYKINRALRLLGGYYDNSPDKDTQFPFFQ